MSISPGTTSLPRASMISADSPVTLALMATMRPLEIATSRTASRRDDASMTRPPLMIRSYLSRVVENADGAQANNAAHEAWYTNWRRFMLWVNESSVSWLLTLELSDRRPRTPRCYRNAYPGGPLERIVSPLPRIRILGATRPSDRWRPYIALYRRKDDLGERRLQSRWLPSRLIPHRHRPRAELHPAHELQVEMLR